MKLGLKVLIILASMWAVISFIIYIDSRLILLSEFNKLEQVQVAGNIERTQKAFDSTIASLALLNTDWSQWDDAYQFMDNKNERFIKTNLAFTTFDNAQLNFILFFDTKGQLFYGKFFDLKKKKFIPIPQNLLNYLEQKRSLTEFNDLKAKISGLINIPEGTLVISSSPILTSQGSGPIRGSLLMGYFLDESHIQKLSVVLKTNARFFPLPLKQTNENLMKAEESFKTSEYYISATPETNYAYFPIKDIDKKSIGIMEIKTPRVLYNEGLRTVQHYFIIVISLGIIILISMWYLLKIFVLDRVVSVSNQVIDITAQSKFGKRIEISGKDELADMVFALNSLMEIIELSQEQLKYRILLRSEELAHLSSLNKNLFSEMQQQKDTELKLRKEEETLRYLAYYDDLTGLPNRIFFNEILQKNIIKAKRESTNLIIFFLDADKFKNINDTYGHAIGDGYLKHVAQQLKYSLRESDIIARLAGDEFILCLGDIASRKQVDELAKKILRNTSTPFKVNGIEIKVTFSIGISIYPQDGETVDELETHADIAMYYAKKQSGNKYCYFDAIEKNISHSTSDSS